ncbi:baseplate assembly protein [Marinomonas mediterranea]|jgi:Phage-related baseplate assembly protein|uniref:Baseplate J family protein n=1 Tax=Marinomonas mediterranea (strain ATCC 700492 / JCM 21426 / NBRC 103028 / MMB-1) TaxID=717774 RepID=F2K225_MARM1|nr:baseplate J/gp47 family protein [Marinomonas mediterranea]ADZ91103.1 Baseplate J family protein [Marinomonas mediterranea MMB-1]WCN13164.1 baseplate assembly protein [Marinomonas mediterranea]WCN17235.1 baseplate assembly protein [Marinomonas mediterranea MMB-1]
MFPHKNQLPIPDIIKTRPYEAVLSNIKESVLAYLAEHDPSIADSVQETFENEAAIITKLIEAFAVIMQATDRQRNAQALQMFGMYATDDDMVDVIVSRLGLERQIIDEGDPNAFPPVAPTMESNDALLTRYYLAVFALSSAGTRSGYRYHAMTLGGRPKIDVQSSESGQVVVTYRYEEHEMGGQTKDAQARQTSPGEVDVRILAHEGDGTPSQALINATKAYLIDRDDIAQETDLVTVQAANIVRWACDATIHLRVGPDREVVRDAAIKAVQEYGDEQNRLGGEIEPSLLYAALASIGGVRRVELNMTDSIQCDYSEVPYLESININVVTAQL